MSRVHKYFNYLFNSIYDFAAPHVCLICKDLISFEREKRSSYICNKCLDTLPLAPDYLHIYNDLIVNIGKDNLFIDKAYSLYFGKEEKGFLEVIHALKYYSKRNAGFEFGKLLWRKIKMENPPNYHYIIPVPIHIAKKRERGFNQSDYISKGVSEASEIPTNKKLIKRSRYTVSQTKLHLDKRKSNVKDVFKVINPSEVKEKNILIVDDVLTTGSTLNSIARILKEAGANRVDIGALLRA